MSSDAVSTPETSLVRISSKIAQAAQQLQLTQIHPIWLSSRGLHRKLGYFALPSAWQFSDHGELDLYFLLPVWCELTRLSQVECSRVTYPHFFGIQKSKSCQSIIDGDSNDRIPIQGSLLSYVAHIVP